mgnify:FL=1|nr:MAG TPA: distal tail protein [Bacteriophage sp.]
MRKFGLTIDGKHTTEYGLKMLSMYIPQPAVKTNLISVPGASGSIDLSEVTGQRCYENRSGLKFEFVLMEPSYDRWAKAMTEIAMQIHGRKVKVIPDNDLGFYYMCRLGVDGKKSNNIAASITLSGTAEPFKYDLTASDDDWLWDPFNFETGIIRELAGITVSNGKSVTITGGGMPTVPEFVVTESESLAVSYNGKSHNMLLPGTYRFPAIKIGADDVTLQFTGRGKLSIRYRGAYL